jgi:hypothetical protein
MTLKVGPEWAHSVDEEAHFETWLVSIFEFTDIVAPC